MKGIKITFFGGMAILLEDEKGYKVLLDPYFSKNPQQVAFPNEFYDVDLICVTHNANDHYGDLTEIMQNGHAALVACNDVVSRLKREYPEVDPDRLFSTIYGDDKCFGDICIRTVYAQHISRTALEEGKGSFAPPLGFVVRFGNGVTYYHAGDTGLTAEIKLIGELYRPNIACIPIDRWKPRQGCVLPPREAAMAMSWIGVEVVIPGHYPPGSEAPKKFAQMMEAFCPFAQIKEDMRKPFLYTPYTVTDIVSEEDFPHEC